ncbi:MAG: hypothetical protein U0Q03_24315 [Acidimicrobiales bacterium]
MRNHQRLHPVRRHVLVGLVAIATAVTAVACGDDADDADAPSGDARPTVTFELTDQSVGAPEHLPGGLVDVTLDATGGTTRTHHLALFRLEDGVTAEQAMSADDATFPTLVTYQGGNSQINPGEIAHFTFDLDAGDYVIADFDENGQVLSATTVVDEPVGSPAEPESKGTIVLGPGMLVTLPDGFDGAGVWKVENHDTEQAHEAGLGAMAPGKTVADLVAWANSFDGPPPAEILGGFGALGPGRHGWVDLGAARTPGDYVVFCAIPGPDGVPHLAMGMATGFTVG